MDADDLGAHVRIGRVLAGEGLGGAPDLEAARRPWVDRGEVVDHERDLAVGPDVAELAGVAQVAAADVDNAGLGIDLEPDGAVLQRAIGRLGGQAPEALGPQVLKFGFGEYHARQTTPPAPAAPRSSGPAAPRSSGPAAPRRAAGVRWCAWVKLYQFPESSRTTASMP